VLRRAGEMLGMGVSYRISVEERDHRVTHARVRRRRRLVIKINGIGHRGDHDAAKLMAELPRACKALFGVAPGGISGFGFPQHRMGAAARHSQRYEAKYEVR
jgi:hypothetical protein